MVNKRADPLRRNFLLLWNGALTLQRGILICLGIYVAVLMVLQVIFRYVLQVSIMWVEELIVYMVFWFFMVGASLCTYNRTHIEGGITNIVFRNRPRAVAFFKFGTNVVSIALSCLFAFWGYQAFVFSLRIHRTTVQLTLPYAYSLLSLLPGFLLMAIYFAAEAIDNFRSGMRLNLTQERQVKQ